MNSGLDRPATAGGIAWLPLVPRPRPPCQPLPARTAELTGIAAVPAEATGHDRISWAAEILNKAALIASDCGPPETARALCHRQYELFDQARPLSAWAVSLALQPLLNIARQLIREGRGQDAYTMLETLCHAAREQTTVVIDGQPVNLAALARAPDGHKALRTLAWTALLADGTRALALAGRWHEAASHAAAHRGIGKRLLDGRQAAILAHLHSGQPDKAAALVDRSAVTQTWERAVQSLLRVLCQHTAVIDAHHQVTEMLTMASDLAKDTDPTTVVTRARLGMLALDLASAGSEAQSRSLRSALIASASRDGYAARDLLAHHQLRAYLTTGQRRDLQNMVQVCGLGTGTIPERPHQELMAAVHWAEATMKKELPRAGTGSIP
jgi:hypothetical protein